nr:uncharacterized protein LOC126535678 [Dermacentor andersoni]
MVSTRAALVTRCWQTSCTRGPAPCPSIWREAASSSPTRRPRHLLHGPVGLGRTASLPSPRLTFPRLNWHSCKEMWVHAYRQKLPTFDRWCKDHFLSDSCMVSSATPVVTSSIQLLPSVKLDTAQEKSTDVPAACIHTTIKSSGASVPLSKYYTIV